MNWLIEYGDIPNDEEDLGFNENNFTSEEIHRDREGNTAMTRLQGEIAQKMWDNYVQYIAN